MKRERARALGIDLGGTKVQIALVNFKGRIIERHRFPTKKDSGANGIIKAIIDTVNEIKEKKETPPIAVGVGAAGQVDLKGVVRSAPNLPFKDELLKEKLEKGTTMPVVVTNDVRAAAYGEWKFGAGKGIDDLVVLFVGTGIGGGVVSEGRLLHGCTNTLGELGHMTLIQNGRKCRCPNHGCLEAYAGGWAIAKRAQEAVSREPEKGKTLLELAGGVEKITAATVSLALRSGDPMARSLFTETGEYLGAGVVSTVNAFNPCLLVLGGGVIEGMPDLIKIVDSHTRKHALKPGLQRLRIEKASLGADAGVIGAAVYALTKLGVGR